MSISGSKPNWGKGDGLPELFNLLAAVAALFATFVQALPIVDKIRRDVVDPPITSPTSGTVWTVGSIQTVTWDTSSLPSQITNTKGTILLGYLNSSSTNEHLITSSPLASGFNITSGSTTVTVPDVAEGDNYIIALMGDSGNISPQFTITSSSSLSGPSSASSSPTTNVEIASSDGSSTTFPASILSTLNPTGSSSTVAPSSSSSSEASTASSTSPTLTTLSSLSSASASSTASASASSTSSSGSTSAANPGMSFSIVHFLFPLVLIGFMI